MAFSQSCISHANELSVLLHIGNGVRAAVAHRRPKPTNHLEDGIAQRSLVGNAALDAFGNELLNIILGILEVSVTASLSHRFNRAHSSIQLVAPSLIQHLFPWAFIDSGEEAADHDHIGTRSDRLGNISGLLHTAIGDQGNSRPGGYAGTLENRSQLGNPDTRNDARCTDRTGPNADFHCIGTGPDEIARSLRRGHVARHELSVGELALEVPHRINHTAGMPVGSIDHHQINPSLQEPSNPFFRIHRNAYRGSNAQPAMSVFACIGMPDLLLDVLEGDQALQDPVPIDNRELFNLVFFENSLGLF